MPLPGGILGSVRSKLRPSRHRERALAHLGGAYLVVACSLVASALARAQSGLSGLPLDNFQFKASHNSYQRDEDMDDQIDNYNAWCVELDLQWETDCGSPGCITVDHCCPLVIECGGEQRLWESTAEIMRSAEIANRVTFIWLDIKESGSFPNGCHEEWPANRREMIRDALVGLLGSDNIYTKAEFDVDFSANGGRWPSWQSLRDRGKKFILVLEDQLDASGKDDDDVFFIAVSSLAAATSTSHATFINIEDANTAYGTPAPNDRYIYRAWNADWNEAVSRGFNLIGTNDIDNGDTITDSRTHSPQPLYVDPFSFNEDRLWGTRGYPVSSISAAVDRATAGITLRLRPGSYAEARTFSKAMTIEKDPRYSGTVVIGKP